MHAPLNWQFLPRLEYVNLVATSKLSCLGRGRTVRWYMTQTSLSKFAPFAGLL
jgi:hypothetical protein